MHNFQFAPFGMFASDFLFSDLAVELANFETEQHFLLPGHERLYEKSAIPVTIMIDRHRQNVTTVPSSTEGRVSVLTAVRLPPATGDGTLNDLATSTGVLLYEMQDARGIGLNGQASASFAPARYAIERVLCARC